MKPFLQRQVNDPSVLMQTESPSQSLSLGEAHSSRSTDKMKTNDESMSSHGPLIGASVEYQLTKDVVP